MLELLRVEIVQTVDFTIVWVGSLHHGNGLANNNVHRTAVRQKSYIVIEHPSGVEERDGKPEEFLQMTSATKSRLTEPPVTYLDCELHLVYDRMFVWLELLIEIVLAKAKHRHKRLKDRTGKASRWWTTRIRRRAC